MAPIAAGQYYWVYMLASTRYKVFCSYLIGWLTSLAWIATVATETIFAGTILQGLIILNHQNDYDPKMWQGTLLAWLVVAVAIFINVVIPGALPKIEIFIIVFHISGFIAIIAVLWSFSNLNSAHFVFATSLNEGGWPTQGLSYCVGFLGNVATFVGADASVHMAEEVENAPTNIPRAILCSMLVNGTVGFITMITILFCLGNVESVLETATRYPFIQVFYNSVKSTAGATVMGTVVLILTWACATGIITTASRMTWSFARDTGTPFSRFISKVDKRTKVPIIAVFVVTGFACLLTLIYVGSDTAFSDVISLTITGFYGSYLLPSAFLLYHRIKGNILPARPSSLIEDIPLSPKSNDPADDLPMYDRRVSVAQAALVWGPWHIPGIFGTINNAYACIYMVFVIFWSVWPPATPVSASTMNYSVVVTLGVIIFSIVWYYIRGQDEYKGPTVDKEAAQVMRQGSVIEVAR